jgi:hypothetical protein
MYDYYLDPNACLYGLRTGSEALHVMYNTYDGSVMIANNYFDGYKNLQVSISTCDMSGKSRLLGRYTTAVEATSLKNIVSVKERIDSIRAEHGVFLALELKDKSGKLLSENIYWLADQTGNYSGLTKMKPASLDISCRSAGTGKVEVRIRNKHGSPPAFFNRVSLVDAMTKQRVLPAFYDDNYVTVLPGKEKKIIIEYTGKVASPQVSVSGWNHKTSFHGIK